MTSSKLTVSHGQLEYLIDVPADWRYFVSTPLSAIFIVPPKWMPPSRFPILGEDGASIYLMCVSHSMKIDAGKILQFTAEDKLVIAIPAYHSDVSDQMWCFYEAKSTLSPHIDKDPFPILQRSGEKREAMVTVGRISASTKKQPKPDAPPDSPILDIIHHLLG